MSEPRKNNRSKDRGQTKEDNDVTTHKPIPDADTERPYQVPKTVSKSKKNISDEAEENLLYKKKDDKDVTRVDAKYEVSVNGEANIEVNINKQEPAEQKNANDPPWVPLCRLMFTLFWALVWLCMLGFAFALIFRAPKCSTGAPAAKTWFQKGPLVDMSDLSFEEVETHFPLLQSSKATAIFVDVGPTYDVLDRPDLRTRFKKLVEKAKKYELKVIVDLTPNFVSASHKWFTLSVNRTQPYDAYFNWAKGGNYINGAMPEPPNQWVSTFNESAWEWNEERKEFYLHQFGREQPDLNFHNPQVVAEFDKVLRMWMKDGADGVRLRKVRLSLVNSSLPLKFETFSDSDQPGLDGLLSHWSKVVDDSSSSPGAGETVFTVAEETPPELFLLDRNVRSSLRPGFAAPLRLTTPAGVPAFASDLTMRLPMWPAVQLKLSPSDEAAERELASLALLLPAAPVLTLLQLSDGGNDTSASEKQSHLVSLRNDVSTEHGNYQVAALRDNYSNQELLACARWKEGHTGYVAVFNPGSALAHVSLSLASVPAVLSVQHVSHAVRELTHYTNNLPVARDNVLVPPRSTVVLSYIPTDSKEQ